MKRFIGRLALTAGLIAGLLGGPGLIPVQAATATVTFTPRLAKSDITMTDIDSSLIEAVAANAQAHMYDALVECPQLTLVDTTADAVRATESRLSRASGSTIPLMPTAPADYELQGYVTMLSNVKAQSGVLMLSGKDKTVYVELSLRVLERRTGHIVFTATANSRRKSELSYHAVIERRDSSLGDAVEQAVSDAATNLAATMRQAMNG